MELEGGFAQLCSKLNQILKQYLCNRDALFMLIVVIGFTIGEIVIGVLQLDAWIRHNLIGGNLALNIFWGWGMWKATIAILILSVCIQINHYWKCIAIVTCIISFLMGIDRTGDGLNINWQYVTIPHLFQGTWTYLLLNSFYVIITAILVKIWRMKIRK